MYVSQPLIALLTSPKVSVGILSFYVCFYLECLCLFVYRHWCLKVIDGKYYPQLNFDWLFEYTYSTGSDWNIATSYKWIYRVFTKYKMFPVNPVAKHMEHDFSDCLSGKFPGALERRKRYRSPVSSGRNVPNRNSGFYHWKKFRRKTEHLKRESWFSGRNISNGK